MKNVNYEGRRISVNDNDFKELEEISKRQIYTRNYCSKFALAGLLVALCGFSIPHPKIEGNLGDYQKQHYECISEDSKSEKSTLVERLTLGSTFREKLSNMIGIVGLCGVVSSAIFYYTTARPVYNDQRRKILNKYIDKIGE